MISIPFESIVAAIRNVHRTLADCERANDQHKGTYDHEKARRLGIYADPEAAATSLMEQAFLQCIALCQACGLNSLLELVKADYSTGRKDGFLKEAAWEEGTYLVWSERIRSYLSAIEGGLGLRDEGLVDATLVQVLRNTQYLVGDPRLFAKPPQNESEVHDRIDAVLKAVYPDTLHKPRLGKAVKGFEPDTGIPSLHSLIEYKFVARLQDVGPTADEILADTRGYASKDWRHVIFLVYETARFCSEDNWNRLLRDCEISATMKVIVLCGETGTGKTKKRVGRDGGSASCSGESG